MKDSISRDSIGRRGFLGRVFSWALASIPIAAMAGMSWRLLSAPLMNRSKLEESRKVDVSLKDLTGAADFHLLIPILVDDASTNRSVEEPAK